MNSLTKDTNPPAIVQPAEKDEKWDFHFKAAIAFAKRSAKSVIFAGSEMVKAKLACPHGLWNKMLEKHRIKPSTARFWMQSFKKFGQIATTVDLNELSDFLGFKDNSPDSEPQKRDVGEEPEEHPVLVELVVCKNCKRKGRVKDCKTCLDLRQRFLGMGGTRSSASNSGRVKFDWDRFDKHLPSVYGLPERLAKAFPNLVGTPEHSEATELLTQLAKIVEKLRLKSRGKNA